MDLVLYLGSQKTMEYAVLAIHADNANTILSLFDYILLGQLHRWSTIKGEAPIMILIFQTLVYHPMN